MTKYRLALENGFSNHDAPSRKSEERGMAAKQAKPPLAFVVKAFCSPKLRPLATGGRAKCNGTLQAPMASLCLLTYHRRKCRRGNATIEVVSTSVSTAYTIRPMDGTSLAVTPSAGHNFTQGLE
ncbi:hypothetical protein TARUN_8523 [Trichoderma arundinaceum]|uniref:Uncharacterized protein n=1 Tax=Trichoderma arundinaceum TaxID=490622 RepID=A0A395NDB9_TRIAR|nr:hypothetical protein TARUN_8523 [Trichoderma arundinaceum]